MKILMSKRINDIDIYKYTSKSKLMKLYNEDKSLYYKVLHKMATHPVTNIVQYVFLAPVIPEDIIEYIYDRCNSNEMHSLYCLRGIAKYPYTSPEILAQLAQSDYVEIRYTVASNRNTPEDILIALQDDDDRDVSHAAKDTLLAQFGVGEEE
jgi:hypothetical protein